MWTEVVQALALTLSGYAEDAGLQAEIFDPVPGEALVEIDTGRSRLYAEPAEFNGQELPAIVWLYAFPTMRRVRLVGNVDGPWQIESSDGVPFHNDLSPATFNQLVEDLNVVAA